MEKTIIKFGGIEFQKQKFLHYKGPASIKNININKIAVSNKISFHKKDLNISLATKMLKKLGPCAYFRK